MIEKSDLKKYGSIFLFVFLQLPYFFICSLLFSFFVPDEHSLDPREVDLIVGTMLALFNVAHALLTKKVCGKSADFAMFIITEGSSALIVAYCILTLDQPKFLDLGFAESSITILSTSGILFALYCLIALILRKVKK